jgi:hypothetical protein
MVRLKPGHTDDALKSVAIKVETEVRSFFRLFAADRATGASELFRRRV